MTFFNPFNKFNCFFGGMNNWFTPMFSCWNSPPMLNFNFLFMNNWNFFSPYQENHHPGSNFSIFNNMTFTYDNPNCMNIWNGQTGYSYMPCYDVFTPSSPPHKNEKNQRKENNKKPTKSYNRNVSGNINNSYLSLSKNAAINKAKNDSNLEELSSGNGWEISSASFKTDIPFAKKGTGKILEKVSRLVGKKLVITSALGTGEAGNPHQKGGYVSHHNASNPKLDIRIPEGYSSATFAKKLEATGYFSHILNEGTHIDVQIDPEKFKMV